MSPRPRILFVAFADSVHAQAWVNLLHGSEFDVRVFTVPLEPVLWAPKWVFPTYVTIQPNSHARDANGIRWLLPNLPRTRSLFNWMEGRFSLSARWLRRVIVSWRPDILHSLALHSGGRLARSALQQIPLSQWPRWVASSWGSDIQVGLGDPDAQGNIDFILRSCDGFMADCRRDLLLAVKAGLSESKLAFGEAVPGSGGLDLGFFERIRNKNHVRNLVVIPKAFEREHANRTFTVIEALRLIEKDLDAFEIHLLMCSKPVINWLRQMPESLQRRCHTHVMLPPTELFEMFGRARVVVAPSLSDGTPNVMLEAMAAGALPLVSSLESTKEWIEEGQNGLFAHALYPDQIASILRRALTDDALFDLAGRMNWDIVARRANRARIREQVLAYYRELVSIGRTQEV